MVFRACLLRPTTKKVAHEPGIRIQPDEHEAAFRSRAAGSDGSPERRPQIRLRILFRSPKRFFVPRPGGTVCAVSEGGLFPLARPPLRPRAQRRPRAAAETACRRSALLPFERHGAGLAGQCDLLRGQGVYGGSEKGLLREPEGNGRFRHHAGDRHHDVPVHRDHLKKIRRVHRPAGEREHAPELHDRHGICRGRIRLVLHQPRSPARPADREDVRRMGQKEQQKNLHAGKQRMSAQLPVADIPRNPAGTSFRARSSSRRSGK